METLRKRLEAGSFVLIEFLIAFEVFIKYYIAACLLKLQYGLSHRVSGLNFFRLLIYSRTISLITTADFPFIVIFI